MKRQTFYICLRNNITNGSVPFIMWMLVLQVYRQGFNRWKPSRVFLQPWQVETVDYQMESIAQLQHLCKRRETKPCRLGCDSFAKRHLASEEPSIWYLDGLVQLRGIIRDGRGHQGHDETLEQAPELRLQDTDQVLRSNGDRGQRGTETDCVCIELNFASFTFCDT